MYLPARMLPPRFSHCGSQLPDNSSAMDLSAKLNGVIVEAHEVYDNYIETTKHPGNALFAIALCVSISSIVGLPLVVKLGQYLFTTKEHEQLCETGKTDDLAFKHIRQNSQADTPQNLCSVLAYLWTIVKFDDETHRIVHLSIPLICSAITHHGMELITLSIISHYLGTDVMLAYSMVLIILSISSSFLSGWIEAIDSLGSMAFGAGNYELTGRYVQTSCVCYLFSMIPAAFFGVATIKKIMLLLGFDKSVADLAESFVLVHLAYNTMAGLFTGMQKFLAVIEKEKYSNGVSCLSSLARVALVALFVIKLKTTSLNMIGVIMLVNSALFFLVGFILVPIKLGWITQFESGLFGRCSNRWSVVKDVFNAARPLAFGVLLEDAEWEIFTLFAATLGPAEAATWATMSFIWDFLESTTSAIGDASEMRVAYQLGKGRPGMAKLAGYKAIFVAFILSVLGSTIFLSLNNTLPSLLTKDATIQRMLLDLFPLISLGNVSMTLGMVAWAVVGGQGRYDLATKIATASSFLVACPIAGGLTKWMNINLQSLVFAIHSGYSLTGTLLLACVQLSDWENLSKKIQEHMAANSDNFDFDSDESSTSIVSTDSPSSSSPEEEEDGAHEEETKKDKCMAFALPQYVILLLVVSQAVE